MFSTQYFNNLVLKRRYRKHVISPTENCLQKHMEKCLKKMVLLLRMFNDIEKHTRKHRSDVIKLGSK